MLLTTSATLPKTAVDTVRCNGTIFVSGQNSSIVENVSTETVSTIGRSDGNKTYRSGNATLWNTGADGVELEKETFKFNLKESRC